jgi:hypothetical protein
VSVRHPIEGRFTGTARTSSSLEPHRRETRLTSTAEAARLVRESAHRALMRALAAGGNTTAALIAYRELRLRLQQELNATPDPETRALYEQLREAAHAKAGARREATHHNLPVPLTSFIGREQEMDEVRRHLASTRLLTLTGTGGCGKTRLALEAAAELREEVAGGVCPVELAALLDSLGCRPTGGCSAAGVSGPAHPGHEPREA